MQEIYKLALNSMQSDMLKINNVAQNITNSATPAYKREVTISRPFSQVIENSIATHSSMTLNSETARDMQIGSLKLTGQKLDLALASQGFFEVQSKEGPLYTRQGNFQVDALGRLVTMQGYPVLGRGGEIRIDTAKPTIDAQGKIFDGDRLIDQIKIVDFNDAKSMHRTGNGYFTAGISEKSVAEMDLNVKQGYLENSNISAAHEMVQLMESMRHFESMVRLTQGYDEMLGMAVRKLGEV